MTHRLPTLLLLVGLVAAPARGHAQAAPSADTLRPLVAARALLAPFGGSQGERIWPGYRPDTIPTAFVLPGRGVALMGWRGPLPDGYAALSGWPDVAWSPTAERGASNTSIELEGRRVAQVVADTPDSVELFAVAAHEAFHVFERTVARDGLRFGGHENAFYVSQYPVFDARNEAGVALEGRLLRAALDARAPELARTLAQQFVAVRESRQRRMGAAIAEYEAMAEINEGPAEYAQWRAYAFAGAADRVRQRRESLDSLTADTRQSFRLRFYRTGPAMAALLDRLAPPGWQGRMVAGNQTLQEALADAVSYREREAALVAAAGRRFGLPALESGAQRAVRDLRTRRARQVDSVLARPGLTVVIAGSVGACGFDPQNTLRVSGTVALHTRWLRLCRGAFDAEFTTPVVADDSAATHTAVVGAEDAVRLTVAGSAVSLEGLTRLDGATGVRLEAPGLTLRAALADLVRDGRALRVTVR